MTLRVNSLFLSFPYLPSYNLFFSGTITLKPRHIFFGSCMSLNKSIAVIGGGAAGFFSAICTAQLAQQKGLSPDIRIFEASEHVLKKVRISGGGRCNVTHNCFDVKLFCKNYPRGSRELLSPMQRFQASDTVEWFKNAGVQLIAEPDGRMFPDTNSSETIIECFLA